MRNCKSTILFLIFALNIFVTQIIFAVNISRDQVNIIHFKSVFLNDQVDRNFHYKEQFVSYYNQSAKHFLSLDENTNHIIIDSLFLESELLSKKLSYKQKNYGIITTFFADERGIQVESFRVLLEKKLESTSNIIGYSSNYIPYLAFYNTKDGIDSTVYFKFQRVFIDVMRDTIIDGSIKDRFNNLDLSVKLNAYIPLSGKVTDYDFFRPNECKLCNNVSKLVSNTLFLLNKVGEAYEKKLSFKKINQFAIDINDYADIQGRYPHSFHLFQAVLALKDLLYQETTKNDPSNARILDTLNLRLKVLKDDYLNIEISDNELNQWQKNGADYYDCANRVYEYFLTNNGACEQLLDSARQCELNKRYFEAKAFYRAVKNKECGNKQAAVDGLKKIIKFELEERYKMSNLIDDYWFKNMRKAAYELSTRANINITNRFEDGIKPDLRGGVVNIQNLVKRTVESTNSEGVIKINYSLVELENGVEGVLYIDSNSFITGTQKIANYPYGKYKYPEVDIFFGMCVQLIKDIAGSVGMEPNSNQFKVEVIGSSDGVPFYGTVKMPKDFDLEQEICVTYPLNMQAKSLSELPSSSLGSNLKLAAARGGYLKNYLKLNEIECNDVIFVNAFEEASADKRNVRLRFHIDLIK